MNKINKTGNRPGFSLVELIAILGISAILAGVAFPKLTNHLNDSKIRTEAGNLDSVFQKARMMAATTQKPVRVVLNCTLKTSKGCFLALQTPVFSGTEVSSWNEVPSFRHECDPSVSAIGDPGSTAYDGKEKVAGIFWAIFMPDSQVYSTPRPFNLFFFRKDAKNEIRPGWRVILSNDSGRVAIQSDEAKVG
ncbi:MAG: prepilin-type N-terminal cleavage/methylation domain-containing protein [Deltaproteobacteria bacterium]|jgi:Tfp pilus assembly protein FimT|nr:prepilin-type N-terminal cleavage/methylation domain-containing protein [Deltaproteobacteria bacterium]